MDTSNTSITTKTYVQIYTRKQGRMGAGRMSEETGAKALKGEWEYIKTKLFEEVTYTRNITGKGKLIQIYDPNASMDSPAYWEWEEEHKVETSDVPAGYKVRVVAATVKFT
ncbi:hypothetical protein CIRG_02164 [Coccidioides immitis RMSCC 2394]|uniref:Uncharacterized protein n=1 Tax=Coccidioides immitis RMSCC 2394 TaxID=404692 RepID=A0A0J6Y2U2_COCIT|nr:hypothetical protein CIRG_02164 [Coccidioides immitis RMSCC 2394]